MQKITCEARLPWSARWITAPFKEHPVFRARFTTAQTDGLSLRMCGLGLYECYCNGKKVTEEVLLPGYHSYDKRLMFQTFPLDGLAVSGENELTILLAPGWYMGRFCFGGGKENLYGDRMTLIAEVRAAAAAHGAAGEGGGSEACGEDGCTVLLASDTAWQCAPGPVLESGIYDGEVWDARREAIPEDAWKNAVLMPENEAQSLSARLEPRSNPLILPQQTLNPAQIITTPKGDTVLDFGQNLTGWFTFTADVPAGERITVEAAELLQDGEFFRGNLRTAKARYEYISDGSPKAVRPHFTFYGFRYLRVTGCPDAEKAGFQAVVISSSMARTGWLETGNAEVNRLLENIRWGMVDNFLDVPTDCPQRDERMGWTGDTQIFSAAACYLADTAEFYTKFLRDVRLEQQALGGSVPFVVPNPPTELMPAMGPAHGSCAWGDVATILPWNLYRFYGDKERLAEQYPGMKMWVEYIRGQESADHLWLTGFHFADWLALDNPQPGPIGKTDPYYCASAYYYHSVNLTAQAAKVLGCDGDAAEYAALAEKIKEGFVSRFFTAGGACVQDTQTALVVALWLGLHPQDGAPALAARLHEKLAENGMHLDTGFIGTGWLCRALAKAGLQEDAVSLLLNREMPGWLYPVRMGATTVWERWDSILPDGHINPEGMNSLNHYAYGAVAEWMYADLCGLQPDAPGFGTAVFRPLPDARLGFVRCRYDSAAGRYEAAWQASGDGFVYELTVPEGCTAAVRLPGRETFRVGAGSHRFE